jgi:hypothetical protein
MAKWVNDLFKDIKEINKILVTPGTFLSAHTSKVVPSILIFGPTP